MNPERDNLAVYSDWLLEKGDPLGEIIATALKGQLDLDLADSYADERFRPFDEGVKARWDPGTGLVRSLELETERGGDFIRALAREPALRLLETLDLGVYIDDEEEGAGPSNPFAALEGAPFSPSLRELSFWMERGDPDHEAASHDYTELLRHVPFVERLALESPMGLRAMDLPNLRQLQLNEPLYRKVLEDLVAAKLPALESLEIQDRYWRYNGFNPAYPKLDCLRYVCEPSTRENARVLFQHLVHSPLVRRVGVLDLSRTVDATNATVLAEHAESLLHLRELRVGETCGALNRALGSRVQVVKE